MKCPICRKEVQPDDPFAPFCSDRCRIIDLANWATEKYVIPAPLDPQNPETLPDENLPDQEDDSE